MSLFFKLSILLPYVSVEMESFFGCGSIQLKLEWNKTVTFSKWREKILKQLNHWRIVTVTLYLIIFEKYINCLSSIHFEKITILSLNSKLFLVLSSFSTWNIRISVFIAFDVRTRCYYSLCRSILVVA